MAGRYPGSYPDRSSGWRAAAILAGIGQASPVERIPLKNKGLSSARTRMVSAWANDWQPVAAGLDADESRALPHDERAILRATRVQHGLRS
jgi:hypothetical protein